MRDYPRASAERALERVRAGDIDAYAEVVRLHQAEVWRVVAFSLCDSALGADLVQQTFVKAFFSLERFEPGRDFAAWLRGIARNLVREELRRRGRETRRYLAYGQHLAATHGEDERGDERETALRAALARCAGKLAEPSQRAIALRYEQALDLAEVAQTLGRTLAGTRQLLQRVRLQLRECIEKQLEAP